MCRRKEMKCLCVYLILKVDSYSLRTAGFHPKVVVCFRGKNV